MNSKIENLTKLDSNEIGLIIYTVYKKNRESYLNKINNCRNDLCEANVHSTRVSIRRLLAVLNLTEKFISSPYIPEIKTAVRKQLKALARLRDIQVAISKTEKELNRFPNIEPFFNYLLGQETALISALAFKLKKIDLKEIEGPSLFLLLSLQNQIAATNYDISFCKKSIAEAHAKVVDCVNAIDPTDLSTIHKTRIAFKKFRYLMEFFLAYLDVHSHLNKRMNAYQTRMGLVQDMDFYINEYDGFISKNKNIDKNEFMEARKAFIFERNTYACDFIAAKNEIFEFLK